MTRQSRNLDDPNHPPSPEGGWSCRVRTVAGGIVHHLRDGYLVNPSGVLDSSGQFVAESVLWRGRPLMVPPPPPAETEDVAGRWLWAGRLQGHFGHFLMESIGRLWAIDALPGKIDGIVFVPSRDVATRSSGPALKSYQRDILDLMDIDLPVRIVDRPTRFETLEVPGQGFGIGPLIKGTDPFRRFIHDRLGRTIAAAPAQDIYISRSRLDPSLGGILLENRLELFLAGQGYQVYHPQDHSVAEQIAVYKGARNIIGLDGSALHLFAMVARPDQNLALILRRKGAAPDGIIDHITAFSGRRPLAIDALARSWSRSDRGRADNFSFGQLDFRLLGKNLVAGGFVPEGTEWPGFPDRRFEEAIRAIESRLARKGFTYSPEQAASA